METDVQELRLVLVLRVVPEKGSDSLVESGVDLLLAYVQYFFQVAHQDELPFEAVRPPEHAFDHNLGGSFVLEGKSLVEETYLINAHGDVVVVMTLVQMCERLRNIYAIYQLFESPLFLWLLNF